MRETEKEQRIQNVLDWLDKLPSIQVTTEANGWSAAHGYLLQLTKLILERDGLRLIEALAKAKQRISERLHSLSPEQSAGWQKHWPDVRPVLTSQPPPPAPATPQTAREIEADLGLVEPDGGGLGAAHQYIVNLAIAYQNERKVSVSDSIDAARLYVEQNLYRLNHEQVEYWIRDQGIKRPVVPRPVSVPSAKVREMKASEDW